MVVVLGLAPFMHYRMTKDWMVAGAASAVVVQSSDGIVYFRGSCSHPVNEIVIKRQWRVTSCLSVAAVAVAVPVKFHLVIADGEDDRDGE